MPAHVYRPSIGTSLLTLQCGLGFTSEAPVSSGRNWKSRQKSDPYVKAAHKAGWRSRAAFKLLELDERDRLLRPGDVVVDLGAAPGGWSQVAAERVGGRGRVIATDLLDMPPVPGVRFLQGDFREDAVLRALEAELEGRRADLVLSDMAPNISGVAASDQARSMHLAELALEFAAEWLEPSGRFLVKVFQGEGFDAFLADVRAVFTSVKVRKPPASRSESREVYILAAGRRVQ